MFHEDDLLPISALQHMLYCDRQCALIHNEQTWSDNSYTVEGAHLHRTVDEQNGESRGDLLISRSMPVRSLRLGLVGRADVVEFRRVNCADQGAHIPGHQGRWQPYPVEYKRGRPKSHRADEVQLCAQALCLEERFGLSIRAGALFYGARRRRLEVVFDAPLRLLTEATTDRVRTMLGAGATPPAEFGPKCEKCSLRPACLPQASASANAFIARAVRALRADSEAQ